MIICASNWLATNKVNPPAAVQAPKPLIRNVTACSLGGFSGSFTVRPLAVCDHFPCSINAGRLVGRQAFQALLQNCRTEHHSHQGGEPFSQDAFGLLCQTLQVGVQVAFRLCVQDLSPRRVGFNRCPFAPSAIPDFLATLDTPDPHKSMSSTCRFRLAGGCVVADAVLWVSLLAVTSLCSTRSWLETPGRSPFPHLWRAASCGLRVVQNPRRTPISVFRDCFHSRSVSPVAFSARRLSWLRINRSVARPTASLDTEHGASAYSGGIRTP